MPMGQFLYHGQGVAVDGGITSPVSQTVDGHAKCSLPDNNSGHYSAHHDGLTIPEILSYGACYSSVVAMPEDSGGFFRTEIRTTITNLNVSGAIQLQADRITMGMVTVYRRHWYDNGAVHAKRSRTLPIGCSFGSLMINGQPAASWLPAPFFYSGDKRESYLHGDEPDASIDSEIQAAVDGSDSRFVYIPDFGRIFFGEWGITKGSDSEDVHQLSMLRLALGSPVKGVMLFDSGQGDGHPTPP